jgi:hypothetical protein
MAAPEPTEVTVLLKAWSGADQTALDRLMPVAYGELRRIAHRYMRNERVGITLHSSLEGLLNSHFGGAGSR